MPDATTVAEPEGLRRLILATSLTDPAHACFVPVEGREAVDALLASTLTGDFKCGCGVVFKASLATISWTTEYDRRCLRSKWGGSV